MPAENGLIATGFFFLPSENIRFSNVSRGYEKRPVGGMKCVKQICISINTNSVFQYKPKNKEANQPQLFSYLPSSRIFQ